MVKKKKLNKEAAHKDKTTYNLKYKKFSSIIPMWHKVDFKITNIIQDEHVTLQK